MDTESILKTAPLFAGFSEAELARLLPLLSARRQAVHKGQVLLQAGAQVKSIGVVLEGRIEALKTTAAGGAFTVARMGPGGVFGDILSGGHSLSPVRVVATCAGHILLLPYKALFRAPAREGELFRRLLANLVAVLSDKYFALDRRVDLLLIRGLRARIAFFLTAEAKRQNSTLFTVPYNREQLAAYLGCERSALSRELSRMAAEGLIETHRSHFRLLMPEKLAGSDL